VVVETRTSEHEQRNQGLAEAIAKFSLDKAAAEKHRLEEKQRAVRRYNEKHKIKGQGEQFVLISPADAAKRNIREGDPVRVYNDRGDFEGVAKVHALR
jgi:predicted molibdopterin-dependent oxidoreductase YjgC